MTKSIFVLTLAAILISAVFLGFNKKEKHSLPAPLSVSNTSEKNFIHFVLNDKWFGALPSSRDASDSKLYIRNNFSDYKDSLYLNGLLLYGYDIVTSGAADEPVSDYIEGINSLITDIRAAGFKGYYGRNKIEAACYSQRVEYEAEGGNNGFSYQVHNGKKLTDSGRTAINMNKTFNPPGMLCESIYENLQHTDFFNFTQHDYGLWFLKPSMRISRSDYSPGDTSTVVTILVTAFNGTTAKSINVRVKDFMQGADYNGEYVNTFPNLRTQLQIEGGTSPGQLNEGRTEDWWEWPLPGKEGECKIDFKIYWHGKVNVWFDKMIVDNENADKLFKGEFNAMIQNEVNALAIDPAAEYLYIDEMSYSMMPAVKYVQKFIKENTNKPTLKLHNALSNYITMRGQRNDDFSFGPYLSEIRPPSFHLDAHQVPEVLPNTLKSYFKGAKLVSTAEYNDWVQENMLGDKSSKDLGIWGALWESPGTAGGYIYESIFNRDRIKPPFTGSLVYQIAKAKRQIDSINQITPYNTNFVMQPQMHGYMAKDASGNYYGMREPTNEEIEVQAMISIARGADGLCWFEYQTQFIPGDGYWCYGLQDLSQASGHRNINWYGQDKWRAFSAMSKKIKNWKPVLDKINWREGYSTHSEGAEYNFVSDIESMYRNVSGEYATDDGDKYWEMGFFNPIDGNDKTNFFMMVNRRCVPETSAGAGDLRELRVKFNGANLQGSNNWRVVDVNTNQPVFTINKSSEEYYNFGIFNPGEGKLYKLEPVN